MTKDNDMVMRADLPGMKREDVKERGYGSFKRRMALPEGVDKGKQRRASRTVS